MKGFLIQFYIERDRLGAGFKKKHMSLMHQQFQSRIQLAQNLSFEESYTFYFLWLIAIQVHIEMLSESRLST